MGPALRCKVLIAFGVMIGLSWTCSADDQAQDRSKYKYGYVISHKGGGSQAHVESRDGNLALGRYYVRLRNGTGQKVTYFADDLGFHTGVSYSSQDGKGSSSTHIAVGQKALDAFGNPDVTQNAAAIAARPILLFGKKILKTAFNTATPRPGSFPQLNYTPVPGGFFLTHEPETQTSNDTTERPGYVSASPSRASTPGQPPQQPDPTTQTFYSTTHNVNELRIDSTTPSIKSYTSLPQESIFFSPTPAPLAHFSQGVKVSSYVTGPNDLFYSNQKSIEKTSFAEIDAQLISEVQKHAEGIIMKDLERSQSSEGGARSSSPAFHPSTVTLQPIVVTNDGETGINAAVPTTPVPEGRKLGKNSQLESLNALKAGGKDSDQTLEDSGLFRVSLSPSLSSSINVSQAPHQSINVDSTNRNSDSNNSTLCGFNLCQKDGGGEIFSVDLSEGKPKKEVEDSGSGDVSDGLGTNKVIRTFYPENKLHDERHYITTIDVQKAISLDVNQDEAGSIHFAQNFPFNKIKPFDQVQAHTPAPQPLPPAQISLAPGSLLLNLNYVNSPQQPYVLGAVTAAPNLVEVPNQNLPVLNGLNDLTSGQYTSAFQDRIGTNRYEYENQLVVPPPPVDLTNQQTNELTQSSQDDLKQVDKSIQALSQQILSDIDAHHEEEQRKQNFVDQERKQYLQNLQKVEELKNQNSISYSLPVPRQPNVIQATASRVNSAEGVSNVELVPQTQYVSPAPVSYEPPPPSPPPQTQYVSPSPVSYEPPPPPPPPQTQYEQPQQPQYESSGEAQYDPQPQTVYGPSIQTYQTEIKDFRHEVAVPQTNLQQISDLDVYRKSPLPYNSREIQTSNGERQYGLYDSQNVYSVDNSIQQSAPAEKIQLTNYAQAVPPVAAVAPVAPLAPVAPVAPAAPVSSVAFQPRYAVASAPENPKPLTVLNSQLNTVGLASGVLPQPAKETTSKALLLNNIVPLDYSRFLQVQQPLSLFPSYPVSLPAESKLVQGLYSAPQQVALPFQISQQYKLTYPEVSTVASNQYHSTLTQRPTNKLRVQPLKPSTPDDSAQRDAVQNLLSQPQFHRTYYYPGLPVNSRLQLRQIRKNQVSSPDQARSQSARRAKSLKNLRIEYGFKPPLRPSVEFSEEVKPSIYGPSVQPH